MRNADLNISVEDFVSQYTQLRHWEGRMYTDAQVLELPNITNHPHSREWSFRNTSAEKLFAYLKRKDSPLRILDVGCGNGWLTAYLSKLEGSFVEGIDINNVELSQAIRLFGNRDNLRFTQSTVEDITNENYFDILIFSASLQYFSPLKELLNNCIRILKPSGEIHILDTHFYSISKITAARNRSESYFNAVGFPNLANYYFHHCLDDLEAFQYQVLYDPNSLFTRFLRNRNPFYWIRIQK